MSRYKYGIDTTHQMPNRTWVVPEEQVKEFMSGPINYNELIKDCLRSMSNKTEKKQSRQDKRRKTSIFTIEI